MPRPRHIPAPHGARQGGFSLVWVLVIVAGLAAAALVLAPNGGTDRDRELAAQEEQTLARITGALELHALRHQIIPGPADWISATAQTAGMDTNAVRLTFPTFRTDLSSQRLYLVDPRFQPNLVAGILPLTLPSSGIDPASPNAPNAYARAIVLSVSKRGMALPLASGLINAALFDNLWDWVNDPALNTTPLAGLSPAWNRPLGAYLHVGRVNYQPLFHKVSFRKLTYAVDGGVPVMVTNTADRYFLQGTPLSLYALTNGMLVVRHVVAREASFDLGSPYEPLGWWKFEDLVGSHLAINLGRLGSAADAVLTNSCTTTLSTLKAPPYTGYPGLNQSLALDGVDDYGDTGASMANGLTQFTLSCWVNPSSLAAGPALAFCGQYGVLEFGFSSGTPRKLEIRTATAGTLDAPYAHPANEWHHVAVTGDGAVLRIYLDGILAASGGGPPAGGYYGSNGNHFRIGGGGVFDGVGNSFPGELDEVCLFSRALSAAQVAGLKINQLPF
jgi:hypothetical protein